MSAPAYESYKDSGVEWLGQVPRHWKINRLKVSIATCKGGIWGDEANSGEDDIICIRVADFSRHNFRITLAAPTYRNIASKDRHGRILKRGDLLIEKSGGGEKQPVGAVTLYDHDVPAVCSNFVARLELMQDMHPAYWTYVHAAAYDRALTVRCLNQTSGIQNLDLTRYLDEIAPFPPTSEQTAIAAFLDRETGKIDALIEAQTRLIELLKEKRQAVISHAVTKGLNPDLPMKDSGIEWLGQVPAHWQSLQLGRLCKQVSDGPHYSPTYVDEGVMFISARNIRVDGWSLDDAKFVSETDYEEFCRRVIPERGDILYTKGGTTGIARVVDLTERFQVWVHVAVLKLWQDRAVPEFVAYALNGLGCYEQSQLHTRGATNKDLGLTRMIKIWLALPPPSEQNAVVAYLNEATARIDRLTAQANAAINLLNERRAALISAAVTGKIDVRELVNIESEAA